MLACAASGALGFGLGHASRSDSSLLSPFSLHPSELEREFITSQFSASLSVTVIVAGVMGVMRIATHFAARVTGSVIGNAATTLATAGIYFGVGLLRVRLKHMKDQEYAAKLFSWLTAGVLASRAVLAVVLGASIGFQFTAEPAAAVAMAGSVLFHHASMIFLVPQPMPRFGLSVTYSVLAHRIPLISQRMPLWQQRAIFTSIPLIGWSLGFMLERVALRSFIASRTPYSCSQPRAAVSPTATTATATASPTATAATASASAPVAAGWTPGWPSYSSIARGSALVRRADRARQPER